MGLCQINHVFHIVWSISWQKMNYRGMTLIEVSVATVIGTLLLLPVALTTTRWAREAEQQKLRLEGTVLLSMALDALEHLDLHDGQGRSEIQFGDHPWSLSWSMESPMLPSELTIEDRMDLALLVVVLRFEQHDLSVQGSRLIRENLNQPGKLVLRVSTQ